MKILKLSTLLFVAAIALASCAKQYDVVVTENTGNSGSGAGNYDWSGTAPLSAVVDGKAFQAITPFYAEASGKILVGGYTENNFSVIRLVLPIGATAGKVYNLINNPDAQGWYQDINVGNFATFSGSGKCKVTINNATEIEGYFYFDGHDPNANKDAKISKGYFKVAKQ